MTILTEEQTQELISGALEKIKDSVLESATQEAVWATQRAVGNKVQEIVNKFIEEEVAPQIIVNLKENQSAIVKAAILSAENMAELLAKSLTDQLAENLGTAYKRKKIFEGMFE